MHFINTLYDDMRVKRVIVFCLNWAIMVVPIISLGHIEDMNGAVGMGW